jgi:hypothetical protein
MTGALEELADWLVSEKVTLAGMESTGVYWKPVYYEAYRKLSLKKCSERIALKAVR